MKTDEQERFQTATQEIEKARRGLAKAVNNALDHKVGDQCIKQLDILAGVLAKIR